MTLIRIAPRQKGCSEKNPQNNQHGRHVKIFWHSVRQSRTTDTVSNPAPLSSHSQTPTTHLFLLLITLVSLSLLLPYEPLSSTTHVLSGSPSLPHRPHHRPYSPLPAFYTPGCEISDPLQLVVSSAILFTFPNSKPQHNLPHRLHFFLCTYFPRHNPLRPVPHQRNFRHVHRRFTSRHGADILSADAPSLTLPSRRWHIRSPEHTIRGIPAEGGDHGAVWSERFRPGNRQTRRSLHM